MKYVILIQSSPAPWGHPTSDYLAEFQALPAEVRAEREAEFDKLFAEMTERGELISGTALGDPADARLGRWGTDGPVVTDGPYAETKEQLAGFFLIDVADQARAEQILAAFSAPGETVELRPVYPMD